MHEDDSSGDTEILSEEEAIPPSPQPKGNRSFMSQRKNGAKNTLPNDDDSPPKSTASEPASDVTKTSKEWTCKDVHLWITQLFNEEIANKFVDQDIDGPALLSDCIVKEESMKVLGLDTIGKRAKFVDSIQKLKGCEATSPPAKKLKLNAEDRVLTNKEKDQLTSLDRTLYNTKKKRIINHAKKLWPSNKPTPKFRSSMEHSKKLEEVAEELASNDYYTMPSAGLGKSAITNIIRRHMMERRRKDSDPLLNRSLEDNTESDTSSCSTSQELPASCKYSPPKEIQEKVSSYQAYFKNGLSLSSAQAIMLKYLTKTKVKDLRLEKLKKMAKDLGLKLLRNKDKDTHLLGIASTLLKLQHVKLAEGITLSRITQDDVEIVKK